LDEGEEQHRVVEDRDSSDAGTAAATIMTTYRLGRVFSGMPLTMIVFGRKFAATLIPLIDVPDPNMIAPSFLSLTDLPTGRKIARLSLGRDAFGAEEVRRAVEYDLHSLGREQFLEQWAPDWEDSDGD
jgi:hypothetical protein